MTWIIISAASGGVLVVVSLIGAITRGGGGLTRPLLLLSLIGCLMAGAFLFTGFRSTGSQSTFPSMLSPNVSIAVSPPQVDAIQSMTWPHEQQGDHQARKRSKSRRLVKSRADTGSTGNQYFATGTSDGVSSVQLAPPAIKENRRNKVNVAGMGVAALAVIALLYVGYLFLDAGTRGQFTWLLRITSIVAFAVICVVVAMVRQRM